MKIHNLVHCRGDGTFYFSPYAWPGGYPILYYDDQGSAFCPECATILYNQSIYGDSETNYILVAGEVFYEGSKEYCAECNRELESAYGESGE